MKKIRNDKESLIESEKKVPGNGYLWKNQNNLPIKQKFNAQLRKNSPKDKNIKSLKKVYYFVIQPLNPEKFENNQTKTIPNDNFFSVNPNEKFEKELEFLEESKKLCIKFDKPITYDNVMKKLHEELHNFELK